MISNGVHLQLYPYKSDTIPMTPALTKLNKLSSHETPQLIGLVKP